MKINAYVDCGEGNNCKLVFESVEVEKNIFESYINMIENEIIDYKEFNECYYLEKVCYENGCEFIFNCEKMSLSCEGDRVNCFVKEIQIFLNKLEEKIKEFIEGENKEENLEESKEIK